MIYNLGKYRYKDCKIYKQVWGFIYRCIDQGPLPYMTGVKRVNSLCGIKGANKDYSMLERIADHNSLNGSFLVNFKKPEGFFGNDPLPATVRPYRGKLLVKWSNGWEAQCDCTAFNVFKLKEVV